MAVRLRSGNSPTLRTLQWLAMHGWIADNTERRQGPVSFDWCGGIDIIAVHPMTKEILFLQVTSAPNHAARVTKLLALARIRELVVAGFAVEVWSWSDKPEPRRERLTAV